MNNLRNIAFAAATTLSLTNLADIALAKDKTPPSDCETMFGTEGAFTLDTSAPAPLLTLNGGDLEGVEISFNDDVDGMTFSRNGQTENVPFVSTTSSMFNGDFEAPFIEGLTCTYLAVSAYDDKVASVFCGNTGINLANNEISVSIQAGEAHMRTPFIASCTTTMSLEP